MALPGWLDRNEMRCFPFLADTTGREVTGPLTLNNLPRTAVVDCRFILESDVAYDHATHYVRLTTVARSGSNFIFTFSSNCVELADQALVFTLPTTGPQYHASTAVDLLPESVSTGDSIVVYCNRQRWRGVLTCGALAELNAFLAGDGSISAGAIPLTVEPTCVFSSHKTRVTSVSVANANRTRATHNVLDCDPIAWEYPAEHIFVNARCLTGTVVFRAGYNAAIVDNGRDTLTFIAGVGRGEGQPCDTVKLFAAETPPPGSDLLEGGLRCNEVLRAINGQGGPIFTLVSSSGVSIIPDPDNNEVKINVDMQGLAVCYESVSYVSVSL